jgi:hypothetical protein
MKGSYPPDGGRVVRSHPSQQSPENFPGLFYVYCLRIILFSKKFNKTKIKKLYTAVGVPPTVSSPFSLSKKSYL